MERKNKTLLDDLIKAYYSIKCEGSLYSCKGCSNKLICDDIENLIKSIKKLY